MLTPFEFNEASKFYKSIFIKLDFGTEQVVVVCEVDEAQGRRDLLLDLHGLLVDEVQSGRSFVTWVHGEGDQLLAFALD